MNIFEAVALVARFEKFLASAKEDPTATEAEGMPLGEGETLVTFEFGLFATKLRDGSYWTILGNVEPSGTLREVAMALFDWADGEGLLSREVRR